MGFFDDLFGQPFGGMFDFNGDGKTDFGESWLGYKIIEDCMKEEKDDDPYSYSGSSFASSLDDEDSDGDVDWRLFADEGDEYGVDPYDFDSEAEYREAVEDATLTIATKVVEDWKILADDGIDRGGISPYDYDTEEDYLEALEDVGFAAPTDVYDDTAPINITFTVDYPGKTALEAINPSDYPNQRVYKAAYYLCELNLGTAFISSDTTKEKEIKKCEFILSQSCIAARYLTIYDGFLFAQAVKENFSLPFDVPDEDDEIKTYFDDLFLEIAEENVILAVDIWVWLIKEFAPYKEYIKSDWTIYNSIISSVDDYPPEFLVECIKRLGSNHTFANGVFTENPQYPYGAAHFVSTALSMGLNNEAQVIFTAVALNKSAKSKDMENLINTIISNCSNWEELETMEAFKFYILPIIKKMNDKRIQRLLPDFIETVDYYIRSVEASEKKYQYSRRFAWRKNCADGSAYGLDPLDYETEADFNDAIEKQKYAWRRWRKRDAEKFNLNLSDYETEDAFKAALDKERLKVRIPKIDPLLEADDNIYTFCGVQFNWANRPYHYLAGNHNVKIGDLVIVPVGNDGIERIVEVVSVSQCKRTSAPFPLDKAKTIIGIYSGDKKTAECPLCKKRISADECYEICCAECLQGVPGLISYDEIIQGKETCEKCRYHF